MDVSKLKYMNHKDQITQAIEKGALFGGDIWQNDSEGRKLFQIVELEANPSSDKIIFKLLDSKGLDHSAPLFVRLCYRNIIFRLNPGQFFVSGEDLVGEYPHEVRALEPRKGSRYVLPFHSQISLSLKRAEKMMKGTTLDIEVRIIDVSDKGFGILISNANRDYLKKNDHFWIKAIDNKPLMDHLYGTVTYVAPKGYFLKRGDVRVGLSLKQPVSHEILDYLKSKCHLVLEA